MYAVFIFVN